LALSLNHIFFTFILSYLKKYYFVNVLATLITKNGAQCFSHRRRKYHILLRALAARCSPAAFLPVATLFYVVSCHKSIGFSGIGRSPGTIDKVQKSIIDSILHH